MTKDRIILAVSILFAFLLWIPQKLTKNYRHKIPLKVSVLTPNDRQVIDDVVQVFPIEIAGRGAKLSRVDGAIKQDTLLLPYRGVSLQQSFFESEIIPAIRSQYNIDPSISIRPEISSLTFDFDSIRSRVVPIRSQLQYDFATGYGQIGTLQLVPSEVTITGPYDVVSSIPYVATRVINWPSLAASKSDEIALESDTTGVVTYSTQKTIATVDVDQLVEKEVMVALQPFTKKEIGWKLFPEKILVRLSVPMQLYNTVHPSDIALTLIDQGDQAVSVQIDSVPSQIQYINHSPKIVRYFMQQNDSLK